MKSSDTKSSATKSSDTKSSAMKSSDTNPTNYLWLVTSKKKPSMTYIYLNEKGKKISGNSVSKSCTESPYSGESIYKTSICVGVAKNFVKSIVENQ
tara:strand:- start:190 stop:477 length:288 start_codon:yes stop_codon:yes gene_type:complete